MKVKELNPSNITFLSSYDDSAAIDEYISKLQKKFGSVGIVYEKSSVKEIINGEVVDLIQITINIEYPSLKHNGWTYYGTIESVPVLDEKENNAGYENMLYSPIKDNDILLKYKDLEKFRCDHCNTNHIRKTVHLFVHEDKKEFIIGTACSKEYFGIDVYLQLSKILNLFPKMIDILDEIEDKFSFPRRGFSHFSKSAFCKIVYSTVKENGRYVSKSSIDEFSKEIPTSSISEYIYNSKPNGTIEEKELYEKKEEILKEYQDADVLEKVYQYWQNKEDDSIFTNNVQTSLKMIEPKFGLITYAVYEYMREVEDFTGKYKFTERKKLSKHISVIGDKIKGTEVEIINISNFETQYGVMYIISMIDASDNVIVWKTGAPDGLKGEKRVIKTAIIKEHSTYQNINQTIVKNLKFIPLDN